MATREMLSTYNKYLVPPNQLEFAEYVFRLDIFNPNAEDKKWINEDDMKTLLVIINALANTCGGVLDIRNKNGNWLKYSDVNQLHAALSRQRNSIYKNWLTVINDELFGNLLVVRKSDVFLAASSHMYTRHSDETTEVFSHDKLSAILNQTSGNHPTSSDFLSGQVLVYRGPCTLSKSRDWSHCDCLSVDDLLKTITEKKIERDMFAMPNLPNGGHLIIGVQEFPKGYVFFGMELNTEDKKLLLAKLSTFMMFDLEGMPRVWGKLPHTDIKRGIHWFCEFLPLKPSSSGRYLIHIYFPHCPGGVFLRKPEAFVLKENGEVDEVDFTQWSKIFQGSSDDISATCTSQPEALISSASNPKSCTTVNFAETKDNVTLQFSTHSSHRRQIHCTNIAMSEVMHPENFGLFKMSSPINFTPARNEIESVLSDKSLLKAIDKEVDNTEAFGVAADSLFSCIKPSASWEKPPYHLMDVLAVNRLASIILFVICYRIESKGDLGMQRAYTMTLGRILKMKIAHNSKCNDIIVECKILRLGGRHFRSSQLKLFPASSASPNDVCKALARILTDVPGTHFSDKIKKDASLEMSSQNNTIHSDEIRFNFIRGPPGCGKTLLAQTICLKHPDDKSVYISKSQQLTDFISSKFGINTKCVLTNPQLLSLIRNQPAEVQNIVIDDAQNMRADSDTIKEVLDYCQKKRKTLFVLEDCRYQNFQHKTNQISFANVYFKNKDKCRYVDESTHTLQVTRRNSAMVGSYIATLLQDIAPNNQAQCESVTIGDDVFVKHIPNLRALNNNGLVAHVREILSYPSVDCFSKYYTVQDVVILVDHSDPEVLKEELKFFSEVFKSPEQESCGDEIVIHSLDNFCGLEARVVVFVLPKTPSDDDLRSISNPKYTLAIASRGIDRVDFVQEANWTVDQLKDLKFDSIPENLLKDTCSSEESIGSRERSTSPAKRDTAVSSEASVKVIPVDMYDLDVDDLLKNHSSVYKMSQMPRGRAVIVNNINFPHDERLGADIDSRNLRQLFEQLGFKTKVYEDQTAQKMKDIFLKESRREEHKDFDCLIVFVLSHGELGMVLGTKNERVSIDKDIVTPFDGKHCPALIDKPKIFFIQACQDAPEFKSSGTQTDCEVQNSGPEAEVTTNRESSEEFTCNLQKQDDTKLFHDTHDKSDIVVAYSTVPGYVSWRHEDRGSWFVQAIVDVFSKEACKKDLRSLLVEVRRQIANDKAFHTQKSFVQLTRTDETTKKDIYFFPGYHEGMRDDRL